MTEIVTQINVVFDYLSSFWFLHINRHKFSYSFLGFVFQNSRRENRENITRWYMFTQMEFLVVLLPRNQNR